MSRISPRSTYVGILGAQGLARGMLFAALVSYWVVEARLGPLQLVLLGTSLEAMLFVLQVPTGAFADSVGRRPATVIGYAGLGLGLGLQGLTRDFGTLLALQAAAGAAWAFLGGSIEAWIADNASPEDLERVFLRGGQADMGGLMAGLCMTVALGQLDPRLPILAGGGVLLLVSAAAAILMKEDLHAAGGRATPSWRGIAGAAAQGTTAIARNRTLFLLVLVALALGISSEGWDRLYTAHLMRDLGLESAGRLSPVGWLAVIGLCESALGVAAFQLAALRPRNGAAGVWLAGLYVGRAGLMLAFAFALSLPLAVVAFLGAETLRRLGQPLIDAWIAREAPAAARATVLSVVGQADSLGQIAAGPLVGLLAAAASLPAAFAVSAALMIPAASLALRAARRPAPGVGVSSPA